MSKCYTCDLEFASPKEISEHTKSKAHNDRYEQVMLSNPAVVPVTKQDVEKWIDEYVRPVYLGGNHIFSVDQGRKYFRVWSQYAPDEFNTTGGQKSCWGFVDFNGFILKAASWKKPAAHVRGNINSSTIGLEALDNHGFVRYLS